jgi:hypothetical protein
MKTRPHTSLLSWLGLGLMVWVLAAKTWHVFESGHSHHDHHCKHHHHDDSEEDDCRICDWVLPAFHLADEVVFEIAAFESFCKAFPFYSAPVVSESGGSFRNKAPPTA